MAMLLKNVQVTNFRSIEGSNEVKIDPEVTVLVGQNESGKTAFLQAIHRTNPIKDDVKFNVENDYPRKGMIEYKKRHENKPDKVVKLTFELESQEIKDINEAFDFELLSELSFSVYFDYKGNKTITISIIEKPYITHLLETSSLTIETKKIISSLNSVKNIISTLKEADLNEKEQEFLSELENNFPQANNWNSLVEFRVWSKFLSANLPKFFYFDDYYILPGKVNLQNLRDKVANKNNKPLSGEDQAVLSLLAMAGIDLDDLLNESGYENVKASLESISNSITDQIFDYWTQNKELEVEFDIRADAKEDAPYNNGNNLYIRIRNRRHRVSVPFNQRSKGFIWFFSFIVWFDSVREQIESNQNVVLLLDEPGLSLHAMAQADLLRYIDALAEEHQVLYTTHSPFMVRHDSLHQARTVQDEERVGTKVGEDLTNSDPKTIFPLQAALGYDIAQNLFISKRNLLVEGPADLLYLNYFSVQLEQEGREGLRHDVTVIPTGGLDKIATFIALLGGNKLEFVVLHDFKDQPDQRISSLVKEKLIQEKQVFNYAMFRNGLANSKSKSSSVPLINSDVEDLLPVDFYLDLFSETFADKLNKKKIKESQLPLGDRIVQRIEQFLLKSKISIRPSGGFNHYLVAKRLIEKSLSIKNDETLDVFEELFKKINKQF